MSTSLPPRCATRFRPERPLGEGGFGSVWLARQTGLEREVAIKVIRADADPGAAERFTTEARVTAALEHPAIVKVIDHDVEDGVPWIAYEFLPGRTLAARVAEAPLGYTAALDMAVQIAGALGAAHAANVIHRDVKPENVMEAGPDRWKLADFGIAKWTAASVHTQSGMLLGTPSHMAPELFGGAPASPATDLYALSVTLYEAWTGVTPFAAPTLAGLINCVLGDVPAPPSAHVPGLPRAADELMARLLDKKPGARPASGDALIAELERVRGAARSVGRPSGRVRTGRPGDTAAMSMAGRVVDTAAVPRAPEPTVAAPAARFPRGFAWLAVAALALAGVQFWPARKPTAGASATPAAPTARPDPPATPAAPPPLDAALMPLHARLAESWHRANNFVPAERPAAEAALISMFPDTVELLSQAAALPGQGERVLVVEAAMWIRMIDGVIPRRDESRFRAAMATFHGALKRLVERVRDPAVLCVAHALIGALDFSFAKGGARFESTLSYDAARRHFDALSADVRFSPSGLAWRAHMTLRSIDAGRYGMKREWDGVREPRSREYMLKPCGDLPSMFDEISKRYRPESQEMQLAAYDCARSYWVLIGDDDAEEFHRDALPKAPAVIAFCERVNLVPDYDHGISLGRSIRNALDKARARR